MSHTSIVMVNYNGLQYLKQTLPPLLALHSTEIIVVDNGSSDGSIKYLQSQPVKLVHCREVGSKNAACNQGMHIAHGKYILLLDNDALISHMDLIEDLERMYDERIGAIGIAFYNKGEARSKYYGTYLNSFFSVTNAPRPLNELYALHGSEIMYPSGMAVFIEKKKWQEVGGYNRELRFGGDDVELGIKLQLAGYKNILYAKNLLVHLGMPERADDQKYALKFQRMLTAQLYIISVYSKGSTLLRNIFFHQLRSFAKALKQSFMRKSSRVFFSFFIALGAWLSLFTLMKENRRHINHAELRFVEAPLAPSH